MGRERRRFIAAVQPPVEVPPGKVELRELRAQLRGDLVEPLGLIGGAGDRSTLDAHPRLPRANPPCKCGCLPAAVGRLSAQIGGGGEAARPGSGTIGTRPVPAPLVRSDETRTTPNWVAEVQSLLR